MLVIREAFELDHLSRKQLRLFGGVLGALPPFTIATVLTLRDASDARLAAALLFYASAIGAIVGAWRAPQAVASGDGRGETIAAGFAGVAIGTALLIAACSTLAVLSNPVPGVVLVVLLIVLAGAATGLVIGTAIGLPAAAVSVWLLRRLVGAR